MMNNGSLVPPLAVNDEENEEWHDDIITSLPSNNKSTPRCQAFLMTGDKILNLTPKISPSYAKARQEQLPPTMEVTSDQQQQRGPFDDFPSLHHKTKSGARRGLMVAAVPSSQSENALAVVDDGDGVSSGQEEEELQSSMTVNATGDCGGNMVILSDSTNAMIMRGGNEVMENNVGRFHVNHRPEKTRSEPSSPAKASSVSVIRTSREQSSSGDRNPVEPNTIEAAVRLARRLYMLDGFRKENVCAHLSKNNEFSWSVANEYVAQFHFGGVRLDGALREFLSRFCLVGETHERERVLQHFSRHYHRSNPSLFNSEDEVHALTCALLLLNSDLENPGNSVKMTQREFIENVGHMGHVYKTDLLKTLYNSIKQAPIQWARDGAVPLKRGESRQRCSSATTSMLALTDTENQIEYKHGWLMRKSLYDSDGRRTPFGRRGWRMFYATVKGMVLYLHKDERGFRRGQYQTFSNAILLHHSMAESAAADYKKKLNVFRIRTANLGEFLFQTSEPEEVRSWLEAINFVAAAFSMPALPAPTSSQSQAFHKPLLPSAPTKLSMPHQLTSHEEKVQEMIQCLAAVRSNAPSLKARGKCVYEFFVKERYLDQERERYSLYCQILRHRLRAICPAAPQANGHHLTATVKRPGEPFESAKSSVNCLGSVDEEMMNEKTTTGYRRTETPDPQDPQHLDADRISYKEAIISFSRD